MVDDAQRAEKLRIIGRHRVGLPLLFYENHRWNVGLINISCRPEMDGTLHHRAETFSDDRIVNHGSFRIPSNG